MSLCFVSNIAVTELINKIRKFLMEQEEFWWLKSRAIWIALGDANTKFFHHFASARRNVNVVWDLVDHAGKSISYEWALMEVRKFHF